MQNPHVLRPDDASRNTQPDREGWFSRGEYQRRLARTRTEMADRGLDGLIVFSPANFCYLTGHHSIDSWEFRAAVITHDRPPLPLLYQFERGRFEASAWLDEARYYGPGDNHAALVRAMAHDAGLATARIGIEASTNLSVQLHREICEALKPAVPTDVARLVDHVRLCKSEEELKCMEKAAELTGVGLAAAIKHAEPGSADHEIAAAATGAMLRAGSHNLVMMPTIAVGERSGLAHSEHIGRIVAPGDTVFIELSGCWRHYSAPVMHTKYIGTPDATWLKIRRVADETAQAIVDAARPGARACDVARQGHDAMRHIERDVQFHYNFGYSQGICFPPHWLEESAFYLTEQNHQQLQAGMVFHLPLTFRILGRYAAGTSRTIVITDNGARVLTGSNYDKP